MKCQDTIAFMGPYLDSELDPTTTFRIQAHLARCETCRERFAQEERLERRLASSLRRSPGSRAEDEQAWMRALAGCGLASATTRDGLWTFWRKRVPLHWLTLAASLALLSFFMSAGNGLRHGGISSTYHGSLQR